MSPSSTIERLREVIRVIEAVPEQHFVMTTWMNECGTSGCAIGWATKDPYFKDLGLCLVESLIYGLGRPPRWVPAFAGAGGAEALEIFFDLEQGQVDYIFFDDSYPAEQDENMDDGQPGPITKSMVIDHINEVIHQVSHFAGAQE